MDWRATCFGAVRVGDVVSFQGRTGTVVSVDHTDKPGGSILLFCKDTLPMQGAATTLIEVWR